MAALICNFPSSIICSTLKLLNQALAIKNPFCATNNTSQDLQGAVGMYFVSNCVSLYQI